MKTKDNTTIGFFGGTATLIPTDPVERSAYFKGLGLNENDFKPSPIYTLGDKHCNPKNLSKSGKS